MEKLIISMLNTLGYGKNGIMTNSPEMFVERLGMCSTETDFKLRESGDTKVLIDAETYGEKVTLGFTFDKDTRRINKIEVNTD